MSLTQKLMDGIALFTETTARYFAQKEGIEADRRRMLSEADAKKIELQEQVDGFVSGAENKLYGSLSHVRLTHNQALVPNEGGTAPVGWTLGYSTAEEVEYVRSGETATSRSALAREFLRALNSDIQHFAGGFRIWRLTWNPAAHYYGMYQYIRLPNDCTAGAIVKHESGAVPHSHWCGGLKAGEEAKWCGTVYGGGNRYTHCHPYTKSDPVDGIGTILVALPAVISGRVPLDSSGKPKWGQFPSIISPNNDTAGFKVYD